MASSTPTSPPQTDETTTPPSPSPQPQPQPDPTASWPMPRVQNVVATVNLGCRLDLRTLAQHARNVELGLKRFHALVMRIREPRTTTLVFASGKMVVTGAKSEVLARLAARKHARAIQKCGFSTTFSDFRVQNFVGSCAVGFPIRLEGMHRHCAGAHFEPEIFPGLVYRMANPSLTCLVFTNGKVVITGAKAEADVRRAFANLYPLLLDCKLHP